VLCCCSQPAAAAGDVFAAAAGRLSFIADVMVAVGMILRIGCVTDEAVVIVMNKQNVSNSGIVSLFDILLTDTREGINCRKYLRDDDANI